MSIFTAEVHIVNTIDWRCVSYLEFNYDWAAGGDRVKCIAEQDRHVNSEAAIKGFWPVIYQKNQLSFALLDCTETMLPGSYDVVVRQMFTGAGINNMFQDPAANGW